MPIQKLADRKKAREICKEINSILLKNKITEFKVSSRNLLNLHPGPVLWFDPCPFKKFFYSKHVGKLKNVFAYKKATRAVDMIRDDEIHLTNLVLNEGNDPSEFSEVFQRCGFMRFFIPDDFCSSKNKCTSSNCSNQFWMNNKSGSLPIDDYRKNVFIYCLTSIFNKRNHWFEYANHDSGVCIEYDFEIPNGPSNGLIHYGRIHYDKGYDFEFVKEINNQIRKKYDMSITPTGITQMAMMYKRDKYSWEEELRISVNTNDNPTASHIIGSTAGVSLINGNVLKIKNGCGYLNWKIKKVVLGGRISKADERKIVKVCTAKAIPVEK